MIAPLNRRLAASPDPARRTSRGGPGPDPTRRASREDPGRSAPESDRPRYRVVRIIARLNVGGPALNVLHLGAGLRKAYPTLLVTGSVDEGEVEVDLRPYGVDVHRIPQLGRRILPWDDLFALWKVYRLLRSVRPEIVHTHTAKAGALGRVAAWLARVPVRLHTFHGHTFHGYFGPLATRLFLAIERGLARLTTRIVVLSESQARDIVHSYRVCDRAHVEIIRLGLDLERFRPHRTNGARESFRDELGLRDGVPVVTTVGRLVPIKNHDLFIDVAASLVRRGVEAMFVIVGGGPEEPRLRARVAELGLSRHVRLLGWRTDLERIYAGSDVVVLSSRNEGTPVALIEALAAGRAVVATDVGGVRDVLAGGDLGKIVPPDQPEALARAVPWLLADPAARAEYGRRGERSVTRTYTVERLCQDMVGLYDSLLGIPTPHRAGSPVRIHRVRSHPRAVHA